MNVNDDIGAKFVATYYRLLFRSPNDLHKLYDTHAVVTRESQKIIFQVFQLEFNKSLPLNPFNDRIIVKIIDYSSYFVGDSLIVSVYGSWADSTPNSPEYFFTQQFTLCKRNERYMIDNDIFYTFCTTQQTNVFAPPADHMVRMAQVHAQMQVAQSMTMQQPIQQQQYFAPQRQASAPIQPQQSPRSRTHITNPSPTPRKRISDLDPERTITIMNLASYKGNEVAGAYSKFGTITNKNFTYNTVYIEYSTPEEADNAASSPIPPSIPRTSQHVRVEKGVRPKSNDYRRY